MNVYEQFRRKITGATVCLPILFRNDLSVDHAGIEKYLEWILDAGMTNMCLTYGYSQVGFVSADELMDITRTIANVVGDRATFITCTTGTAPVETVATLRQMQELGAGAAFVMPNQHGRGSFRDYLHFVAGETDLPLVFADDPAPYKLHTPTVSVADCQLLVERESIVGLKDDTSILGFRDEVIRTFGERFCIIGAGSRRDYFSYHRYPQQSNLDGFFGPRGALRFLSMLDEGRLAEAMESIQQSEAAYRDRPADLEGLAINQVHMYALGFAETWRVRPPMVSATEEHVRQITEAMHRYPDIFEFP